MKTLAMYHLFQFTVNASLKNRTACKRFASQQFKRVASAKQNALSARKELEKGLF